MAVSDRPMPPPVADERATLAGWLDFYRATLADKCAGLDEQQLRAAAVAPSEMTLLGLVQHVAEVERNWFRRVLMGEDVPPLHPSAGEHSGGFDVHADGTFGQAVSVWHGEIEVARANCAGRALDSTSPFPGGSVTLRWIYSHMIAEYARHCGHADLVRERIDGITGV